MASGIHAAAAAEGEVATMMFAKNRPTRCEWLAGPDGRISDVLQVRMLCGHRRYVRVPFSVPATQFALVDRSGCPDCREIEP